MSDETTFAFGLAFVLLAGTGLAFFAFQEQYYHPRPAEDCSQPYDYPVCRIAAQATASPPHSGAGLYLGSLFAALLTLTLVVLSFKASVLSQQKLIVSARGAQVSAAQTVSQETGPAQTREMPLAPPPAQPSGRTPDAIPYNRIPPEKVAPPAARPKVGVNAAKLEARDG